MIFAGDSIPRRFRASCRPRCRGPFTLDPADAVGPHLVRPVGGRSSRILGRTRAVLATRPSLDRAYLRDDEHGTITSADVMDLRPAARTFPVVWVLDAIGRGHEPTSPRPTAAPGSTFDRTSLVVIVPLTDPGQIGVTLVAAAKTDSAPRECIQRNRASPDCGGRLRT